MPGVAPRRHRSPDSSPDGAGGFAHACNSSLELDQESVSPAPLWGSGCNAVAEPASGPVGRFGPSRAPRQAPLESPDYFRGTRARHAREHFCQRVGPGRVDRTGLQLVLETLEHPLRVSCPSERQ